MSRHTRPPQHSVTAAVIAEMQLYGYRPHDEPDPRPLPDAPDRAHGPHRHLRRHGFDLRGHTPRARRRGTALVRRQPLPPRRTARAAPARRQRGSAAPRAGRTGRLRSQIRRTRTPDRRRHQPDREAQHLRRPHGPGRRTLRAAHRLGLATPRRLQGQSQDHDRSPDRQPRLHRRQTPGRNRDHAAAKAPGSPSPAAPNATTTSGSGTRSTRRSPVTPTWCCCTAQPRKAPNASPPAGPKAARSRKIAFRPDWTKHAKAAPFRRNDQLLATMPKGVIIFPGSGITGNLADKARKLGIPVWRFDTAA